MDIHKCWLIYVLKILFLYWFHSLHIKHSLFFIAINSLKNTWANKIYFPNTSDLLPHPYSHCTLAPSRGSPMPNGSRLTEKKKLPLKIKLSFKGFLKSNMEWRSFKGGKVRILHKGQSLVWIELFLIGSRRLHYGQALTGAVFLHERPFDIVFFLISQQIYDPVWIFFVFLPCFSILQ